MRPILITFTMAALDRNGICLSQKPAVAGNLTIAGAFAASGVATLDYPRHVGIYSAGADTGRTFTVYGTDRNGATVNEAITGPGTGLTVAGSINFKTVTRVAVDAATAGNIEVGTYSSADTAWIVLDYRPITSIAVELSSGASLTYGCEFTMDNVFATDFTEDDAQVLNIFDTKTTNYFASIDYPVKAIRFAVTGFASGTLYGRIQQER